MLTNHSSCLFYFIKKTILKGVKIFLNPYYFYIEKRISLILVGLFTASLRILFRCSRLLVFLDFNCRFIDNHKIIIILFLNMHLMIKNKNVILYIKGIRRYQRGRQKSLNRKTEKTMANKMKRKTNIQNTTLH